MWQARHTRQPDLLVRITRAGAPEQPVFGTVGFDTPEWKIRITGFYGLGLSVAQLVADFIGLGGEVQIGGGDGPAEEGRRHDAHQKQHDDHFNNGESRWAAHRSTSQVWSFPRSVREGQRGGGGSAVCRIKATITPLPAESQ